MQQCLKCGIERRALELRCEQCDTPFSYFSEGQLIKPGNYLLKTVGLSGDSEIVWRAEIYGPDGSRDSQLRELAPPSGEVGKLRKILFDWSQRCRNSGSAIPELLTVFTEKDHLCTVWTLAPSTTLEDFVQTNAASLPRLEALWKSALGNLRQLHSAADDFGHGGIGSAAVHIVGNGTSERVLFAPPSLTAYAEARSGSPVRLLDLKLLGEAFQAAGERILENSIPDGPRDHWTNGPVQAGIQWACGDRCEPATSPGAVLTYMDEVAFAHDKEQLGLWELARNAYVRAAIVARTAFVVDAIRRCEIAASPSGEPPQHPQPTAVSAASQAAPISAPASGSKPPAPPPVAAEPPIPPQPVSPSVAPPSYPAGPKTEKPRAATVPKMEVTAATIPVPIMAPPYPDRKTAPAISVPQPQPEAPRPFVQAPEILANPPSSAAPLPPASPETAGGPEINPGAAPAQSAAASITSSAPKALPPPTRAMAVEIPRKGPKTRSGATAANRSSLPRIGVTSPARRVWIPAVGLLVLGALGVAAWLFHSDSRLNQALALIQKGELVSLDKRKPGAYDLYRQIIKADGPQSGPARAIADAAQPRLDEQIKRALALHYADSNSKEVNWTEMSLITKWREELSAGSEPKIIAEARFCQGMEKLEEGQLAAAILAFDGSQDAAPGWALPRNGKARALFRQGRPNDAEAAYREAVQLDSKWAQPLLNLGNLYMESFNDLDKAEQEYRAALAIQPDLLVADYFLGVLYHSKGAGFYTQSCTSLQRATATSGPRTLDAHMVQYANELMLSVCR